MRLVEIENIKVGTENIQGYVIFENKGYAIVMCMVDNSRMDFKVNTEYCKNIKEEI